MAIQGKDSHVGEGCHAALLCGFGGEPRSVVEHSRVPILFKGGVIYFVQPWLAKTARDASWLAIGLGAACFVLFWLHRDELERLR
jgi:hypothetical protein